MQEILYEGLLSSKDHSNHLTRITLPSNLDANDLGQKVYQEFIKKRDDRYDHDGVFIVKNSGRNNAFGSIIQCFLVVEPLKKYFLKEKHLELGLCEPPLVKQIVSEIFH